MKRGMRIFLHCAGSILVAATLHASEGPVLTLQQAVEIVLSENPLSLVARQGVDAAENGRLAARGAFLPAFKTELNYTLIKDIPQITLPETPSIPVVDAHGVVTGGTVPIPAKSLDAGSDQQIVVTTSLQQPVFTGFALLSQYQLAGLGRTEAEIRAQSTRQDLIFKTHEAYFGVLVAQKLLEVADQSVRQLESHAEVAHEFFLAGIIPKNDSLKAAVELANTKQKRIEAAHRLDTARSAFNTLLHRDITAPVVLEDELVMVEYAKTLDECMETALKHSPEILLADVNIRKAEKGVVLARSGFFPTVSLVGALLHEEGGFAEAGKSWSATVNARWNIWEWGSTYYKVKQSEVHKNMAQALYTQAVDSVRLKVRQAYLTVQEWKEAVEVARASIEQAVENFRITEERFREHVTTTTEVLDAQTMLARAQFNYFSALSNYHIALADLERAMGVLEERR